MFFDEPTGLMAGLEPTILWLGVQCANHLIIATRQCIMIQSGSAYSAHCTVEASFNTVFVAKMLSTLQVQVEALTGMTFDIQPFKILEKSNRNNTF